MAGIVHLLAVLCSLQALPAAHGAPSPPKYVELYTEQVVDHFNYELQDTFMERLFLSDVYWKGSGPLFFYTGNEGSIDEFYDNTGFLFELAQNFSALIVFAEHRYYGKSLPYGSSTFSPEHMGYLTAEQALADYAVLISRLRARYSISKVISFGGSYGGMLSAWFRFKYPNSVDGALAASAPIYMVANLTSPYAFFGLVTQDFEKVDKRCPQYVREAFTEIEALAAQGEEGLKEITEAFQLCSPLASDKVEHLKGWVRNSFTSLAMVDYPYPASFLAPLPAYPVTVACHSLLAAESRLHGLAQAAGLFYNGTTGHLSCFNITSEFVECADPTGCGTGPASFSWDFQACTEMRLPCATNNKTDMFPAHSYDPAQHCQQTWDTHSRPGWMATQFWGKDISTASNIIFSNGDLDPWSVGGVTESF
jgi:dipeptidyl-peptidase-2